MNAPTKKLSILVIDDQPRNIESAGTTLIVHEVTTVSTVSEGYEILRDKERHFDVLLTDLKMPVGDFAKWPYNGKPVDEIDAGAFFALQAINRGMLAVICSDTDHHKDIESRMLDILGGCMVGEVPENQRVFFIEARYAALNEDHSQIGAPITKDWKKVLRVTGLIGPRAS